MSAFHIRLISALALGRGETTEKKLAKKIVDTARKPSEPGREGPPFDSTANAHWMLTSALETAISEKFMAFPEPPDGHCAVVCRATGEVRERVTKNETARMER